MLRNIEYIAHIVYNGNSNYYFYQKESKYLLPVEIQTNDYFKLKDSPERIKTIDTLKRFINGMAVKIKGMKIYLFKEGRYYTYTSVEKEGKLFDINCDFTDALDLAITYKTEILIDEEILLQNGFKITKRLIKKALLG